MEEKAERWVYINGEYYRKDEAKVSVFDHGFLYGDGVFEGIRVYDGNVFRLKEHLERLYDSAKSIMLEIPMTMEEMQQAVVDAVRKNGLRNAYIRLVVSRGVGSLSLDPESCSNPQVIIIVDQVRLFSKELYENGLPIVTVPTRRNIPDALNPKIKSLNYLNNVLVKIEANRAGVGEALMLNEHGYVAEGSGDNIFIVKKGVLYTPPGYVGALEGITRRAIMDLADQLGYPVKEQPFTRHDVYIADEAFLTGTAAEVIAVVEVDGRRIGTGKPGPITRRLLEEFRKLVRVDGVQVYPELSAAPQMG
ncbi:branched chain amino acid aminotransferase apoenzyme [Planifilum fulgidum]|jgi:branched-chain amino acid aminotransferase|uniref:Branched-chain-amino-acid aminotransferase n=1 Tax=Planifilum fulgidum TaxID=201973 RepID=A0A1I2MJ33_9BACL|nr:branched-chain-amino-acid transaminase [Planifilum fulgidum]MBO2495329.1 branched-chain-amino-acid transaminase [Bacillota bacterium]MBO2533283.1 branched-chain-amino-acid transaminase [Thermoactinomycetaceae bacterium]SFF91462.1 branched chain amino acid aminotransferase apoenzyme [Planifilum fulgidum]